MGYITEQELEIFAGGAARLTELADWDQDGARDASVVDAAIANACAFVDGYLRHRVKTPVENPSATLKRLVGEEAVYWLRYSRPGTGVMIGDFDKDARAERVKLLESHRDGKLRLDEPMPAKSSAVRSSIVQLGGELTKKKTEGMW